MAYRSDREALVARVAALEREAERAGCLEKRVRELEEENRGLRAQIAKHEAAAEIRVVEAGAAVADLDQVYVDDKLRDYIANIIAATRAPAEHRLAAFADCIVSGARPEDSAKIEQAAKAEARKQGRKYVIPSDIVAVVDEILQSTIILGREADARGVSADDFIRELLDQVEIP